MNCNVLDGLPRRGMSVAALALAWALALAVAPARAADTEPAAAAPAASSLAAARALITDKKWPAAVAELKRVDDSRSADWNNLMGYSLRKGTPPDYAAAEKYYDAALRIDPKHRGALEYSGELYLLTGKLAQAEQRLAALEKVCGPSCEEYVDLKRSVAAFKAGNKPAGPL